MSALSRRRYCVTLVTTVSYRGTVRAASEAAARERAEELWFSDCERFTMDEASLDSILVNEA